MTGAREMLRVRASERAICTGADSRATPFARNFHPFPCHDGLGSPVKRL
jgi:hypothetical protein